jgi:hypothetical protein
MTVLFIGSVCCLNLAWLTYRPWRWRQYVQRKKVPITIYFPCFLN